MTAVGTQLLLIFLLVGMILSPTIVYGRRRVSKEKFKYKGRYLNIHTNSISILYWHLWFEKNVS